MSGTVYFPVRIQTLGGFSLLLGMGEAVSLGNSRTSELLKLILAFGGRDIAQNTISDILWPDADGDKGLQNLKVTLHRLRNLVGKESVLLKEGYLSLNPEVVHVDVWSLEQSLCALERTGAPVCLEAVKSAITKYQDGFLRNEVMSCVVTAHEKLRNRFLRVIGNIVDMLIKQKEWRIALECYQKLTEIDPLVESTYIGLIRCYQELGLISEGLLIYERCRGILARELGAKPSKKMELCRKKLLRQQNEITAASQKRLGDDISKSDALFLLELINESLTISTDSSVVKLILRLSDFLPYQSAVACSVNFREDDEVEALNVLNVNYPEAYLDELISQNLVLKDVVLQENFRNYQMQYWKDTLEKNEMTDDMLKIITLAEDFGFSGVRKGCGYAHGVRDIYGTEGSFFCFHGLKRTRRTKRILSYILPHLHVALSRSANMSKHVDSLTAREIEVVKWMRQGKTSWDISVVLGISENAVRRHIENVLLKLGASSKSHAVALAIKHGYIEQY